MTQTSTTSPSHSEPESNGNERVLHFPHDPEMEPHHQMQFSVISWLLVGEGVSFHTEMQSAYSTGPSDWAICIVFEKLISFEMYRVFQNFDIIL